MAELERRKVSKPFTLDRVIEKGETVNVVAPSFNGTKKSGEIYITESQAKDLIAWGHLEDPAPTAEQK